MLTWRKLTNVVHDDRGAVAVSFALSLPVLLAVISLLGQFALLTNAELTVRHATRIAGRSAMVCLPEEKESHVQRAACLVLSSLSPPARNGTPAEAQQVNKALKKVCGRSFLRDNASRYAYAMQATRFSYEVTDSLSNARSINKYSPPTEIEVTVSYDFHLSFPFAAILFSPRRRMVGGRTGRFLTLSASETVYTSVGRKSAYGIANRLGVL